jgi:hypothetical protein
VRVGLDFDNTLVSYDALFHKVALERLLIPPDVSVTKVAVRDHLRAEGREDDWTELQGYVYGARMDEALAYDGAIAFCHRALARGHELFIVSHRTRHPFVGRPYDLHAAARSWVERRMTSNGDPLVPLDRVFFELTKAEKILRIAACQCDVYIDDLPEILLAPEFPQRTTRLLFDPEGHHGDAVASGLRSFSDWQSLDVYVNCQ